jgi:hypothetical protein
MGGDVFQWNEANIESEYRGLRGGYWYDYIGSYVLASSYRDYYDPTNEYDVFGFRVASVPEPGSIALVVAGGLCLLAFAWRRRQQAA